MNNCVRAAALLLTCALSFPARAQPPAILDLPAWTTQGKFVTAVIEYAGTPFVATADNGFWTVRDGQWATIDVPDVEGDFITSLAFDRLGRLWAGHGYHGVSVNDGEHWRNYDAPDGPLGHRVFRVAVSPVDGDVWLATDLGLARYSVKTDTWRHITRAQGLPADQIAALAFADDGTLYAATQCDGLAIGSAKDDYAAWRVVDGPAREPADAAGDGLPSLLINDVVAGPDGSVYVATCAGLAVSQNRGQTFRYVRGADYADKVAGRTGGPPENWQKAPTPLVEDDVSALALAPGGRLWLGYRHRGAALHDAKTLQPTGTVVETPTTRPFRNGQSVHCIASLPGGLVAGLNGDGLRVLSAGKSAAGAAAIPTTPPPMPAPLSVTPERASELAAQLQAAAPAPLTAAYLGDDWATRGDGTGRYGWQISAFPFYSVNGWPQGYSVEVTVGPNQVNGGPYTWFDTNDSEEPRVLYLANSFRRTSGEWNDGSFDTRSIPPECEGPDLWLRVTVPDTGPHRMALYFLNYDGRSNDNRFRDYLIEVKDGNLDKAAADFAPALARARVSDFYEGVYKQFMLASGQSYWVKINRNHSHVAKVSAVFLDRMPAPGATGRPADQSPHPLLDPDAWGPPAVSPTTAAPSAPVAAAQQMWDTLDARYTDAAVVPLQLPLRLQAYRLAAANNASADLLTNWGWHLHLWDAPARLEFCRQMDAGYAKTVAENPNLTKEERVPMVDRYKKAHP